MAEGRGPGPPENDRPDDPLGAADPVQQLRALPDRYREVLAGQAPEEPGQNAEDPPPEAVEKAAQARDLLDSTARRVERLVEDAKPVADAVENHPPRRGPHNLDAEVVLEVLDTNAERLAQLVETLPEAAGDRPAVRQGLESIAGEIVGEAVSESERRLRAAEQSLDEER